jgi:uncharacterized protein (DUF433 family)
VEGMAMQLEDYFEFEKFDDRECIRVKGTRVLIEILLDEFNQGISPEKIQENYPTVTREQVYASITYYLHYRKEIDAYMEKSREVADAAYQEWLRTHTPSPLEERLRALRSGSTNRK